MSSLESVVVYIIYFFCLSTVNFCLLSRCSDDAFVFYIEFIQLWPQNPSAYRWHCHDQRCASPKGHYPHLDALLAVGDYRIYGRDRTPPLVLPWSGVLVARFVYESIIW